MELKNLHKAIKDQLSDVLPLDNSGFRLEQADYNKKMKNWEVVISYLNEIINKPITSKTSIPEKVEYKRMYKIIKINDSGEVIGFHMYEG
jgi:hypothetical protein